MKPPWLKLKISETKTLHFNINQITSIFQESREGGGIYTELMLTSGEQVTFSHYENMEIINILKAEFKLDLRP